MSQLSEYLNKMTTAQSSFHQINADGSRDTGDIYIQRPGRIRFEYDPPNSALVLAVSNTLSVFDPQGDGMPQNYPLDKTPLGLVLAKRVDLENARMVVGHHYDGTATILSVQDPDHPERGRMDFISQDPKLICANGRFLTKVVSVQYLFWMICSLAENSAQAYLMCHLKSCSGRSVIDLTTSTTA